MLGECLRHHVLEGEFVADLPEVVRLNILSAAPSHYFVLLDQQFHQGLFNFEFFEEKDALVKQVLAVEVFRILLDYLEVLQNCLHDF